MRRRARLSSVRLTARGEPMEAPRPNPMSTHARNLMLSALCAAMVEGCFPDTSLRPSDASLDAPKSDLGASDGDLDAALDGPDASPFADVVATDASDVSDVAEPADAGRCASLPRDPVAAMAVYERLPDATDFAFDGAGELSAASLRDVIGIGAMGARTLRFTGLAGNVTALRYLPSGDLVLALAPAMMGGAIGSGVPGEGAIFTASTGDGGAPRLRVAVGRVGGMAVDREGAVWFSDTPRNRVFRLTFREADGGAPGVDVVPMISDVMAPTALAFDASGRALFVASTAMGGSLYRVGLSRTVLGDLMPSDATGVLRDLGAVSGLAVDQCGSVYVADETGGRVLRAAEPWGAPTPLITDVPGARALAFGQGGTFDADTLFLLSGGAVRAASVRATGVALPVPMR